MRYLHYIITAIVTGMIILFIKDPANSAHYFLGAFVGSLSIWICSMIDEYKKLDSSEPPIKEKSRAAWINWLRRVMN